MRGFSYRRRLHTRVWRWRSLPRSCRPAARGPRTSRPSRACADWRARTRPPGRALHSWTPCFPVERERVPADRLRKWFVLSVGLSFSLFKWKACLLHPHLRPRPGHVRFFLGTVYHALFCQFVGWSRLKQHWTQFQILFAIFSWCLCAKPFPKSVSHLSTQRTFSSWAHGIGREENLAEIPKETAHTRGCGNSARFVEVAGNRSCFQFENQPD